MFVVWMKFLKLNPRQGLEEEMLMAMGMTQNTIVQAVVCLYTHSIV